MNHPRLYRKILLPLDFSDDSLRALRYGLQMARACEAEVTLVTVVEDSFPYPELFAWDRPDQEFYKTMRERALARMKRAVHEAGGHVPVERIVLNGKPREEIVDLAEQIGADVIVMARRGASTLRSAIMGSTTDSVVRSAHCPVLVLPPEATA